MPKDRKTIRAALKKKGFIKGSESHHEYYHLKVDGKIHGINTHLSRGTHYKVYGDNLLSQMQKQLRLNSKKDLLRLIDCPMTKEEYLNVLRAGGFLPPAA